MEQLNAQTAATEMAMVEASQTQSIVTLKDVLDADTHGCLHPKHLLR